MNTNTVKAEQIIKDDVLVLNGAEIPVGSVSVENGLVEVYSDMWRRTTPFYFKADQYVSIQRHPRFDLEDKVSDPLDFLWWLNCRGWKIVPK